MYAPSPTGVTPRFFQRLVHLVLPASCLACSEPVWTPRASLGLCDGCRGRLAAWPGGCAACGEAVASGSTANEATSEGSGRCAGCRDAAPAYDALLAAWSYAPPLDAVVAGLKFRRLDYLGRQLGAAIAERWRVELGGHDWVVPLPLHWSRRLQRGFDQAARIATPIAAALGIPRVGALRRRRRTRPQSRLDREARLGNLEGAFAVRRPTAVAGRRIVLVDDVVTTGATLAAAAAALRRAGAARVTAVAAARTPPTRRSP